MILIKMEERVASFEYTGAKLLFGGGFKFQFQGSVDFYKFGMRFSALVGAIIE